MSVKKAKKQGKQKTGKCTEEAMPDANGPIDFGNEPTDFVKVRKNISKLVEASALHIAGGLITGAKSGHLASAKYLFEAVGLYPATEGTDAPPGEQSLARVLLTRMGIPVEPVIRDEDMMYSTRTDAEGAGPEARKLTKDSTERQRQRRNNPVG